MQKNFLHLVSQLDDMRKDERQESDVRDIKRALKKLAHALDVKNIKEARKAVNELSKVLLMK